MNLFWTFIAIKKVPYGSPIEVMFLAEFTKGLFVEHVLNPELFLESCLRSSLSAPFLSASITGVGLHSSELASLSSIKKPAMRAFCFFC